MRSPLIAFSLFAAVSPTIVSAAPKSPGLQSNEFAHPGSAAADLPQRLDVPQYKRGTPLGGLNLGGASPLGSMLDTDPTREEKKLSKAIAEPDTDAQFGALDRVQRTPATPRPAERTGTTEPGRDPKPVSIPRPGSQPTALPRVPTVPTPRTRTVGSGSRTTSEAGAQSTGTTTSDPDTDGSDTAPVDQTESETEGEEEQTAEETEGEEEQTAEETEDEASDVSSEFAPFAQ